MESFVVVGYDDTPAGKYAYARACQLGMHVIALYDTEPPPETGVSVTPIRVAALSAARVFEAASQHGAVCVVLTDYAHGPMPLLREGLVAARHVCDIHNRPMLGMLIAKYRPDRDPRPYANTLIGVDNTVGSGVASIVAAKLVEQSGGRLQITTVERRRDILQRDAVERLRDRDGEFDLSEVRSETPARKRADLTATRSIIAAHGIDANFDYRLGDPSAILVRAARYGEFDVLVSGIIGVHEHGRHGHIGKLTRKIARLAPVDHLVVFDCVSLGLAEAELAPQLHESVVTLLFGSASGPDAEAAAGLDSD